MAKKQQTELQFIKGVGPRRAEALAESGIFTVHDLIEYFPRAYIDRNQAKSIKEIATELINSDNTLSEQIFDFTFRREYTLICKIVMKQLRQFSKRKMLQLTISDGSSRFAKIIFWNRVEFFDKIYSPE